MLRLILLYLSAQEWVSLVVCICKLVLGFFIVFKEIYNPIVIKLYGSLYFIRENSIT